MTEKQLEMFAVGIQPLAQIAAITYRSLRAQRLPRLVCCIVTPLLLWRFTMSLWQQTTIPMELLSQIQFRETA